jgi:hypothetical protein
MAMTIVALVRSTCPFDFGYAGEAKLCPFIESSPQLDRLKGRSPVQNKPSGNSVVSNDSALQKRHYRNCCNA